MSDKDLEALANRIVRALTAYDERRKENSIYWDLVNWTHSRLREAFQAWTAQEVEFAQYYLSVTDTANAKRELDNEILREALTWAISFIRRNMPHTCTNYPDFTNAEALVRERPVMYGPFQSEMIAREMNNIRE